MDCLVAGKRHDHFGRWYWIFVLCFAVYRTHLPSQRKASTDFVELSTFSCGPISIAENDKNSNVRCTYIQSRLMECSMLKFTLKRCALVRVVFSSAAIATTLISVIEIDGTVSRFFLDSELSIQFGQSGL